MEVHSRQSKSRRAIKKKTLLAIQQGENVKIVLEPGFKIRAENQVLAVQGFDVCRRRGNYGRHTQGLPGQIAEVRMLMKSGQPGLAHQGFKMQWRKPIQYNHDQGQLLYAVLQKQPSIHVHIERSDGTTLGRSWSVPCFGVALSTNEFVASTWGDTAGLMASAMIGTGWFERTGRSVCFPRGESNEVWRLSELGLEWLQSITRDNDVVVP